MVFTRAEQDPAKSAVVSEHCKGLIPCHRTSLACNESLRLQRFLQIRVFFTNLGVNLYSFFQKPQKSFHNQCMLLCRKKPKTNLKRINYLVNQTAKDLLVISIHLSFPSLCFDRDALVQCMMLWTVNMKVRPPPSQVTTHQAFYRCTGIHTTHSVHVGTIKLLRKPYNMLGGGGGGK